MDVSLSVKGSGPGGAYMKIGDKYLDFAVENNGDGAEKRTIALETR